MTTQILPRSTPESQGIASSALLAFVAALDTKVQDMHSLMLVRHGQVVAEGWWSPYRPESPHVLFSLSKSFTSTGAGFAVAEGKISLDDKVISFFPDDLPEKVSDNLAAMTIHDLLSMATGHAEDTLTALWRKDAVNWVQIFLSKPVEHVPGTHFLYNSGATYMVSAIIQKVTGETLLDYLMPRLFEPLGIQNPTWETCPLGISTGGWGLKVKTEDAAKFGQLYLQKGVWDGTQLLSPDWVEKATSKQVSNGDDPNNDWAQGYGYQFWRSRHGSYRGDGAFGQFCFVFPEHDAVLAITSGTNDMGGVMNLVWEHLLPAFGTSALPEDAVAQDALRQKLGSLVLPSIVGKASSPLASQISGKTYQFDVAEGQSIQSIRFEFDEQSDRCVIHVEDKNGQHATTCGLSETGTPNWIEGTSDLTTPDGKRSPIAMSGAWTAENKFAGRLCFYETPFVMWFEAEFKGTDQVLLSHQINVAFGPRDIVTTVGQAV